MAQLDDIIARIQSEHKVLRDDILEVLELYKDPAKEYENVSNFLDTSGILNETDKQKVLNDLNSYQVSYKRWTTYLSTLLSSP